LHHRRCAGQARPADRADLANCVDGLTVGLDRPFSVGDRIRSPDRQIEGSVWGRSD
jgi:hypothetical protein